MSDHPEGVLARLARGVLRHPVVVVLTALGVFVMSAWIGLPPRVDPDLIALLPADQPHAAALARVARETGGINTITLTFTGDDPMAMDATLDALALSLRDLEDVAVALHRIEPDLATHVALMRQNSTDITALALALENDVDGWQDHTVVHALRDREYLLVPGDGRGRIVVKPTQSNVDPAFCERVVDAVHAHIAATDLGSVQHVYSAGPYVFNAASASGIRADFLRTSWLTAVLVLGILIVGFRSLRTPWIVFPPILLAGVANLAVLRVVLGSLNAFTSFGTALLIGLGIDFAVHLMSRFREHRGDGMGIEDAMARAWDRTGRACVVAALTSAAGFAVLSISDFRGLGHLGFALCSGLILSLGAMLVLLPLLLKWLDATPPRRARTQVAWPALSVRRARWGLAGLAVVTAVVLVVGLPRLSFEYDLTRLNRDRMVFSDMDESTRQLVRLGYPPIVVSLPDEATVRSEHRRLQQLHDEGALPHVRTVLSVASLLPDDQRERLGPIQRLVSAAEAHPELSQLHGWTPRQWQPSDVDPGVLALVGGQTRLLLLPTGDLFDLRESSALIDEIDAAVAGAGSEQLAQGAVFRMIQQETPRFVGVAFLLVALLVAVDLRRPIRVVATLGSLVLGMVWAGAVLGLLGVQVTLMNLIGFSILLGLGVDWVLHLAHRLGDGSELGTVLSTVGKAGAVSTLTTMASFVSLLAAGSGGLRSLGELVVVGLAVVSVVSAMSLVLLSVALPTGFRER